MEQLYLLIGIQILWVVVAGWWFVHRKDELPLVVSGFLLYVFGVRAFVLHTGWASPVDITPFGFSVMNDEEAIEVLGLGVLGQSALLLAYLWQQKVSLEGIRPILNEPEARFLKKTIIWLTVLCMPMVFLTRNYVGNQADAGKVVAFEVSSYAFLFPLMLSSLAILTAALWKSGRLRGMEHFWAVSLFLVIAKLTFSPSLRFQFLGWLIAVTFILTAGLPFAKRSAIMALGLVLAMSAFAVAGALRSVEQTDVKADTQYNQKTIVKDNDDSQNVQKNAYERFLSAEDANMLDGFALLRQVYPQMLPFSMGREHLEIFLRPIPRSLWPDKPVGGYMNKLGLTSAAGGGTLGISPSLLGSFYQEGGMWGMILIAALYGIGLAKLVVFSVQRMYPFAGVVMRAVICAFIVPLLRGGDLPGNYAWLGMAFWPCFLVLWLRRREWIYPKRKWNRPKWKVPKTQDIAKVG